MRGRQTKLVNNATVEAGLQHMNVIHMRPRDNNIANRHLASFDWGGEL